MNSIEVRTEKVAAGAFIGYFRTIRTSEWKTVQKGGERQLFGSAQEAELAAWRAMREFWQADVIGTENNRSDMIFAADTIFRPGKKLIQVVKRRR